ncbi:Yos1-like, putative [Trypanosoma equiperdum]|uniref:Yos1-like protein n=4 Tax=Trypanozoon TaxID=39700 RepID=Q38D93_TRYB2|nr:hypothetical protein, conserved [Trypanosoma brucei gambiense DAL972]XP_827557.1 hypothetical protein, conserved [Trypanosoma brucei brucei TREU927]RHW70690.1 Yos1-like [Trypanosoma brucei equiperdum]SCU71824.1 Yos1-like, putative [Trypanosoma equiperdum]EAN77227.1 hypothetical protein, conserved [Trypanosoma brucei brucei TREU927]CBH14753.1 hypothetical protein, conserved [Trypanosoma brucei gambiense DAL972]|eukprot:XP_011777019.1 hypothetical protein, conserved [Trypanosoma brucei gambiense DAL972]
MGFSLAGILQALLLCLNAMAILSERRLLSRYGLASSAVMDSSDIGSETAFSSGDELAGVPRQRPFRESIAALLSSVRTLMRWPLIFINTAVIVFTLLFG